MKKALSFIIAFVLVLALVPAFSVLAVEEGEGPATTGPQAISTGAGFQAMDPAGSYYLTADITIDTTFAGKFTGTLDGKGFTVTVSAPMFQEIDATVSNLKIKGAITKDGDNAGTLSVDVLGGKYTNITNSATVISATHSAGGLFGWAGQAETPIEIKDFTNSAAITGEKCAGGVIGNSGKGVAVNFTDCSNSGAITGKGDSTGGLFGLIQSNGDNHAKINFTNCSNSGVVDAVVDTAGGIAGYGQGYAEMSFTNCKNTAEVKRSAEGSNYPAGGILGHSSGETHFENCTNTGNVSNAVYQAGGIVGIIKDAGYFKNCFNSGAITAATSACGIAATVEGLDGSGFKFEYCGNTGKITAGSDTGSGILGYSKPGASGPEFYYCFNTGDISGNDCVAGIAGYFNGSNAAKFEGCFNTGKLTANGEGYDSCALYWSKYTDDLPAENIKNCYYLEGSAEFEHHFGTGTDYIALDAAKSITAADVASGKLCSLLNEAAGKEVFFQKLGTDKAPVLTKAADGSNSVIKNADGTFSNPAATSKPTGDSAWIYVVLATVAVLGTAFVAKKREN